MKKYILGAAFSLALLASPAFTQAAALTQAQINAIVSLLQSFGADQTTINNVQISLGSGTPTGGGTQPWCHTFNTDLTFGSSGDDIVALRQALGLSGITPTTSNVFDEDTAGYVVHFQAKYGIRQTGYVGPRTRAKLNSLYGCGPNFPPPPVQPAPTAIFTVNEATNVTVSVGDMVNYTWNSTNGTKWHSSYIATRCMNASSNVNGATWKPADGWERGTIGVQVTDAMRGCTLFISYNVYGAGGNARADATVIVTSNTPTPSITVLSPNGGETFQAGQNMNIQWSASNFPSGSTVSIELRPSNNYPVIKIGAVPYTSGSSVWQIPLNTTPGQYIAEVYKADQNGFINPNESAKDVSNAPFSIVAAGTTVSTPITLTSISPSSGPVGTSIRLDGCGSDSTSGFTLVYSGPKSGTASIPVETLGAASGCGYMTITVPADFPAGVYTLQVKNNQTGAMSTNSMTFTVTTPVVANNSYVSLYPTTFQAGITLTISLINAAPNANVSTFCIDPNGVQCQDTNAGMTDAAGRFSKTYDTTGWTIGNYSGWVTVSGVRSNTVNYTVTAPSVSNNPVLSVAPTQITQGGSFTGAVTGAAPNAGVRLFGRGPDGVTSEDPNPGITDSSGNFSRTYPTTGWNIGTYQGWVTVNGVQSNVVSYSVTASPVANNPNLSLSSYNFTRGSQLVVTVTNAAPNANVSTFCIDPNGVQCQDTNAGMTDAAGRFSKTYDTTGWTIGNYSGWVTVSGVQSNLATFTVVAPSTAMVANPGLASALGAFSGATNPVTQSTSGFNYVWNRDLQIGSPYPDDIAALQQALTREGVYAGEITGGFYNQTYLAVKAFQQKHGIEATGYVGLITRAKLNELY